MRKRSILFLCDTIFWYLIYFLPVILYGIYMIHASESGNVLDFATFVTQKLIIIVQVDSNPIFVVLRDLFSIGGVVALFGPSGNYMLVIITYFATMVIIHLCVDFLLFIPRLCHKWLDMYTKGVER